MCSTPVPSIGYLDAHQIHVKNSDSKLARTNCSTQQFLHITNHKYMCRNTSGKLEFIYRFQPYKLERHFRLISFRKLHKYDVHLLDIYV